jgi:hypothetical protein
MKQMEQICINQIKNGYTIYQAGEGTVYLKNKENVIEDVNARLDLAEKNKNN